MIRKSLKGFTLIELIVVIAIIGVLAGILVVTMYSHLRDSRIASTNLNAKNVYNGVSTALTQASAASISVGEGTDDILTDNFSNDGNFDAVPFGSAKLNLEKYLGNQFEGIGFVCYNPTGYSVTYACWADSEDMLDRSSGQLDADAQRQMVSRGQFCGYYPLAN